MLTRTLVATGIVLSLSACGGLGTPRALRERAGAVEHFQVNGEYQAVYKTLLDNMNECMDRMPDTFVEKRLSPGDKTASVDIVSRDFIHTWYMYSVDLRPSGDDATSMDVFRWRAFWGPEFTTKLKKWASKADIDCNDAK